MAKRLLLFFLSGLFLIGCNGESEPPPTSPPSVITATAKAVQTATADALPTSTPIPTDTPLPLPTEAVSSPTVIVVTKSADMSPTPPPVLNPVGTKTPEDFLQQAELNLVTSQSVQIERTFEVRLPGLTQTISSNCELVMPADIYCVSTTASRFTESADSAQSYQIELWQSADNAFVRQEAGAWQDVSVGEPNFMLDEISGLLHMGELTAVNTITETTLNGISVYEIKYTMEPLPFLEKSSGEQAKELLANAQDTNLKATAWVARGKHILLQQNVVLEFLKENSWVHVESNTVFSNHNQLNELSVSAP